MSVLLKISSSLKWSSLFPIPFTLAAPITISVTVRPGPKPGLPSCYVPSLCPSHPHSMASLRSWFLTYYASSLPVADYQSGQCTFIFVHVATPRYAKLQPRHAKLQPPQATATATPRQATAKPRQATAKPHLATATPHLATATLNHATPTQDGAWPRICPCPCPCHCPGPRPGPCP